MKKISQEQWHQSMRGFFAGCLYNAMVDNPNMYLIVGDLGYAMFDKIRKDFPDRFLNTGAAETSMMGIACGLALEGKIPIVYSITTFLLYRPFETIRNYINHEKIPVKLIASGRDKDYAHDGFSHDSTDAKRVLGLWENINTYWPETKEEIPDIVDKIIKSGQPDFVSLRR